MTERIAQLKTTIRAGKHHALRRTEPLPWVPDPGDGPMERMASRLEAVLNAETPVLLPGERIVLTRTVPVLPPLFSPEEWAALTEGRHIHEKGFVCNITPNYAATIAVGLTARRAEVGDELQKARAAGDEEGVSFLSAALRGLDALLHLADRYRRAALAAGREDVAATLAQVPAGPARTLLEALQSFRFLHFALWCEGEYHNTLGRFDQYMLPYLTADLEAGRLTRDSALELLEEFFLSFNRDSDLYPGMQQGDNGQSLMLGGVDGQGKDAFNLLSRLCLEASLELQLIDPKINLRVGKNTPMDIYRLGTELTRVGLGFPQYSNDDVVISGLVALGYRPEDAADYTVAACWEFIIPGWGMDIPNIEALCFAGAALPAIKASLAAGDGFEDMLEGVHQAIVSRARELAGSVHDLWMVPAPFISLLMNGCVVRRRDISQGSRYNHYGIHGTGLSTAADSLSAIKKFVYDEKLLSPRDMLALLETDFAGQEAWRQRLLNQTPRLGERDPAVDGLAADLLRWFAQGLAGLTNDRGGIFRAGTGSAMYYLWHGDKVGATPDGRHAGQPLSANYSPSLQAQRMDPASIVGSFTAPDLTLTVNGGPLTLELHDGLFAQPGSIVKVAALVKTFIDLGGHQLQLNAVNRERLLSAQAHPEDNRNLIVRVWGWSAYFVELDKPYQDHVIARTEMSV